MNRYLFLGILSLAPVAVPLLASAALAGASQNSAVITKSGKKIFMDFVRAGIPSSGPHFPSKHEVRQLFSEIEAALRQEDRIHRS